MWMLDAPVKEQVVKIASVNGIDVYHIKSRKFKTISTNIFFHDDLSKENAAKNALLPAVLRRGCVSHPTFQDIALYLEQLYGAVFDCGVNKKGEHHIAQFYIEHVNDKYAGQDANLFDKCFELLCEIITNPVLDNGVFKKEFVDQEKENLKQLIESRVNDKGQYAVERCFEAMCGDEPFGVYEYGAVEDLNAIDPRSLFEHYRQFVETLPMMVFITGDVEESKIQKAVDRLSALKRGAVKAVARPQTAKQVKEVKHVTDRMSVNQGKLSLGFRTNTGSDSGDYYSLLVYNTVLGGGVHSKLFQGVRERESLAYYAFSRLEKYKGLMVISSGIEIANKDRALDIILKQLEEIKAGKISEYEFNSSMNTIETGVKSLLDSQLQIVDFYLGQALSNGNDTFETLIEKVRKVTKEDVIRIADKIQLDTIYFLTAEDGKE